jgi:hypothetical protein
MISPPRYRLLAVREAGFIPAGNSYRFSTFHMNVTGAMITPERFVRYAVGRMNCAVGT